MQSVSLLEAEAGNVFEQCGIGHLPNYKGRAAAVRL
jgi:hypothetical protein